MTVPVKEICFSQDTKERKQWLLKRQVWLFKCSNSFLGDMKQSPICMLITRHSGKVFNTIISFNAVNMMDYPIFRKFPFVSLFPNKRMFIFIFTIAHINFYISTSLIKAFTTLPLMRICATMSFTIAFLALFRRFKLRCTTTGAFIITPDSSFSFIALFATVRTINCHIAIRCKGFFTNRANIVPSKFSHNHNLI